MAGLFPFRVVGTLGASGFFGAKPVVVAAGGPTIISFPGGGPNSTGPFTGAPISPGDGTGFYDGTNNGGISIGGPATPDPPLLNGAQLSTVAWQGAGFGFIVSMNVVKPQNFFTNVKIVGSGFTLNFPTAAPTYFSSNTDYPGKTVWRWVDGHEFTVGLSAYVATFT